MYGAYSHVEPTECARPDFWNADGPIAAYAAATSASEIAGQESHSAAPPAAATIAQASAPDA